MSVLRLFGLLAIRQRDGFSEKVLEST